MAESRETGAVPSRPVWELKLPRGRKAWLGDRPRIVGVLNCTPDSFSDGGAYSGPDDAVLAALRMVSCGADWIDVGGESTRPGASPVPASVQQDRVLPVIRNLRAETLVPISVDSMDPIVAASALEAGADIVNDVSACRNPGWTSVLKEWESPVVLMHMRGRPRDMQQDPRYPRGVTTEVMQFFAKRLLWMEKQGIDPDRAILDPGIGFGKRVKDNWELIRNIEAVRTFRRPIFLGTSRKSFLREIFGQENKDLDLGTALVNAMALMNGADLLRVHNVPHTLSLVRVFSALRGWPSGPAGNGGHAPDVPSRPGKGRD